MILSKPAKVHRNARSQQGFSLIEVMIVFFVLSVGLLGMAALQMKSMQYNQSSYLRSQATVAAYDMLDRMRVNPTVALAGGYNVTWGGTSPSGGTLAAADMLDWATFLTNTLPTGEGQVTCASGKCTVEVRWIDRVTGSVNGTATNPGVSITMQM